jgi:hypothetical protein
MYKIIMRLATIDTVATTQVLHDNLNNLGVFAATVNGDINKINGEFDKNYTQLLARGASVDNFSEPITWSPATRTSRRTSGTTQRLP